MTTGFEPVVNLYISNLISANANTTNEERKENITLLEKFLTEYEETLLDYQIDYTKKGIKALKRDMVKKTKSNKLWWCISSMDIWNLS